MDRQKPLRLADAARYAMEIACKTLRDLRNAKTATMGAKGQLLYRTRL